MDAHFRAVVKNPVGPATSGRDHSGREAGPAGEGPVAPRTDPEAAIQLRRATDHVRGRQVPRLLPQATSHPVPIRTGARPTRLRGAAAPGSCGPAMAAVEGGRSSESISSMARRSELAPTKERAVPKPVPLRLPCGSAATHRGARDTSRRELAADINSLKYMLNLFLICII